MDEQERLENQEFDLEDILREFGGTVEEPAVEDILQEFSDEPVQEAPAVTDETIRIPGGVSQAPAEPRVTDETIRIPGGVSQPEQMPKVTGDTIRMGEITEQVAAAMDGDTIRMSPVTSDTVRLNTSDLPKGEVRIAEPIQEEEPEAFTDGWEPEYEQPMGSYNPPPPIIVHPRSRLRELKRKLVAGPEKRYYELSGKGLGKLQAAIFFSLLVVLVSAAATVLYGLDMVPQSRLRLMVFSQFFGLLVSALLGSFQLIDGMADLFKGRFTMNTLLVFTFIVCCADGVICLQQLRVPCCAAFSLQVTMSLWGAYHKRYTEMGQMDTMRKATHLDGVAACPDYCDGRKGLLRFEGQVEHFMDHYAAPGTPERILDWYALGALVAGIGVGVTAGVLYGVYAGLQAAAVAMLAAAPAVAFISQTRPMAVLERRLHRLGTVLCGWQGVKGLSGKAVVPVEHSDLFPAGTVKMNGVKFFGPRRPDDIVAYCTALVTADGGGLSGLFQQVSDSRNAPHYTAKDLRAYDGGGIGGTVHGELVLVGSLEFLQQMGVEVPEGIRVSQAVCIAIENELCGLFAVTHEKARAAAAGLNTVCNSNHLRPVVAVSDFAMTDTLLRSRFGSHARKVLYPTQEARAELREKQLPEDATAFLLTTKEGFAPIAYGITGARALKTANLAGLIVSMVGGLLGLGMILTLVLLGALDLLSPANMLAYQLVWLIPGWLISGWTRIL